MRLFALLLLLLIGCGNAGGFGDDGGTNPGPEGSGEFAERVIDESIVHGQGTEAVDIDADGDLDVLVALSLTDAVHLYLNEDRGGSWTTIEIAGGIVAMETEAVDLDGDGDLDVAAVGLFERSGGIGEVTWFENPGDVNGDWTEHAITGATFAGPIYVEAADLSGDDLADLVVGAVEYAGEGRGLWWFRNTGGAFDGPTAIDGDLLDAVSIELTDVDEDGSIDVVAAGRISGELAWYRNASAVFTKNLIASAPGPTDVQVANMDADPELEVVAALGDRLAFYDPPSWMEVAIAASFDASDTSRLAAADFDGDGSTDVAASTMGAGGELRVYVNEAGSFASRTVRTGYAGLNFIAAGDVNGDGRPDLLTTTYSHTPSSDVISWWANGR